MIGSSGIPFTDWLDLPRRGLWTGIHGLMGGRVGVNPPSIPSLGEGQAAAGPAAALGRREGERQWDDRSMQWNIPWESTPGAPTREKSAASILPMILGVAGAGLGAAATGGLGALPMAIGGLGAMGLGQLAGESGEFGGDTAEDFKAGTDSGSPLLNAIGDPMNVLGAIGAFKGAKALSGLG
jgi:hypothetical protein